MNPTITEFLNTIEVMRKTYPFKNDDTFLISTIDYKTESPNMIRLGTVDKETDVEIRLSKEVIHEQHKTLSSKERTL